MKPSWPTCSASRLRLPAGARLPHAGVALGGHGVGAGRVPVSVSKRAPDRQAPPPSCLPLQRLAEQPPGEKVRRSTRGLLSARRIFQKKFASRPRSLTDIGARMSAAGGKADVPATWPGSLLVAMNGLLHCSILVSSRPTTARRAAWTSMRVARVLARPWA